MKRLDDRKISVAHLVFGGVAALAGVAGVAIALVAADRIEISVPPADPVTETIVSTLTETETTTVTGQEPPTDGGCTDEPNEDRLSAVSISTGECAAAIDTVNDRDFFSFAPPEGGQFTFTVSKEAVAAEENGVILVAVSLDGDEVESTTVASDEPFRLPYTVPQGGSVEIAVEDGCDPGGCGIGGYVVEVAST